MSSRFVFYNNQLGKQQLGLYGCTQVQRQLLPYLFKTTSITPATCDPSLVRTGTITPEWDWGDGTCDTLVPVSHVYAAAGAKLVRLGPRSLWSKITTLDAYSDNGIGELLLHRFPALTAAYFSVNQFSGPLDLSANTLMTLGWFYNNQFDSFFGIGNLVAMGDLKLQDNALSQAAVDDVIDQIYAARAAYTHATPALIIDGMNATPGGTYTDPLVTPGAGSSNSDWSWNGTYHDPLTGAAMVYALRNNNGSEGFNTWTITATGI